MIMLFSDEFCGGILQKLVMNLMIVMRAVYDYGVVKSIDRNL